MYSLLSLVNQHIQGLEDSWVSELFSGNWKCFCLFPKIAGAIKFSSFRRISAIFVGQSKFPCKISSTTVRVIWSKESFPAGNASPGNTILVYAYLFFQICPNRGNGLPNSNIVFWHITTFALIFPMVSRGCILIPNFQCDCYHSQWGFHHSVSSLVSKFLRYF